MYFQIRDNKWLEFRSVISLPYDWMVRKWACAEICRDCLLLQMASFIRMHEMTKWYPNYHLKWHQWTQTYWTWTGTCVIIIQARWLWLFRLTNQRSSSFIIPPFIIGSLWYLSRRLAANASILSEKEETKLNCSAFYCGSLPNKEK